MQKTSLTYAGLHLTRHQKNDSYPAKEIAIITLTRIYVLLHEFQALTREIASPTLPAFVTACLQLLKAPAAASNKSGTTPTRLVETIGNALCAVTPLYPTTLRPFSAQVKTAFRIYVAPTTSDSTLIAPQTLQEVSRKLYVLQHYTTPKNGNAEEWAKTLEGFLRNSHATADQVFRAVQESWESSSGYVRQRVSNEGEPQGATDDAAESLPPWTGLSRGADRLIGLLETLAEFLKSPTKLPVITPVSTIIDLTSRITLIVAPSQGPRKQDGTQLNLAIGRDEKDELWSILPDVHVAALDLLTALVQRLQEHAVSSAADLLHQTVRVFDADKHVPLVRERAYVLLRALLLLHGPTLPKLSVNALDKTVQFCCRDVLAAAGHAGPSSSSRTSAKDASTAKPGKQQHSKPSSNADAYLTSTRPATAGTGTSSSGLPATHVAAAARLLEAFLSHLPQQHLKQTLRALVDRAAVLSRAKGAMVASVLNPYRTRTGKTLASVFPFLSREFPRDREVEVLRSNLRGQVASLGPALGEKKEEEGFGADDAEVLERMQRGSDDEDEEAEEEEVGEDSGAQDDDAEMADTRAPPPAPVGGFDLAGLRREGASEVVGEERTTTTTTTSVAGTAGLEPRRTRQTVMLSSTLKRKSEEREAPPPPPAKRVDLGKASSETIGSGVNVGGGNRGSGGKEEEDDSDSDMSVQINAQLEDDDSEGENEG